MPNTLMLKANEIQLTIEGIRKSPTFSGTTMTLEETLEDSVAQERPGKL
jgi:hypothetical protein